MVGRVAKGDFYMKEYFVDCVGVWGCVCWGGVFLHVVCVFVISVFKLCGLQGDVEMGFVVGGLGLASGLAGNSLVLEAVGN